MIKKKIRLPGEVVESDGVLITQLHSTYLFVIGIVGSKPVGMHSVMICR